MRNIIIAGASIENLGAESMSCIAIELAQKLYPENRIIIASTDKKGMGGKVNYRVLPYNFPTVADYHDSIFSVFARKYLGYHVEKRLEKALKNTDLIIDISGYTFTTKFGMEGVWETLNRLYTAQKLRIRYMVLSQSFGPIDINGFFDRNISFLWSKILFKYPEIVEAREQKSYKFMKNIAGKNLRYKPDMVLLYPKQIPYHLFRKRIDSGHAHRQEKQVAIIPNEKVINKTKNGKEYYQILCKIIDDLLETGYGVEIIAHCALDIKLCNELIRYNSGVTFVDCTEYGSSSFDAIVCRYCFAVASRYHAIVHAYRNYVPVVALGWENKYNDLLDIMSQSEYLFDFREKVCEEEVVNKIEDMKRNYEDNSKILKSKIASLRETYE